MVEGSTTRRAVEAQSMSVLSIGVRTPQARERRPVGRWGLIARIIPLFNQLMVGVPMICAQSLHDCHCHTCGPQPGLPEPAGLHGMYWPPLCSIKTSLPEIRGC